MVGTPYNLHPTLLTLQPAPYTLHPSAYTLHPTPSTPKPDLGLTLEAFPLVLVPVLCRVWGLGFKAEG